MRSVKSGKATGRNRATAGHTATKAETGPKHRKHNEFVRRKWIIWLAVKCALVAAAFIRVGYQRLGWGGYWYVDFRVPWR